MKVQSVTQTNTFKARKMPAELSINIGKLRMNMYSDSFIKKDEIKKQIFRIRSLDINGEAKFKDGRFLAKKDKNENWIPYGENTSMIEFGRVKIISDSDGNIIFSRKPFFSRWSSVLKKAGEYIQTALDNYGNDKIVVKNLCKEEQLTYKGKAQLTKEYENIMNLFERLNPYK